MWPAKAGYGLPGLPTIRAWAIIDKKIEFVVYTENII
jgi:hypothetical protein